MFDYWVTIDGLKIKTELTEQEAEALKIDGLKVEKA